MSGFELTNKAKSDLKAIGRYTQNNWGKQQRDFYLTALDRSFHVLASDHLKGHDCSEIRRGYRKYQLGKHP
ncbi:type II toxin-antitoxin system RelE/ParE family toxin [Methylovulum psychrotolerans]|uniref:Toxin ParE1 n=1 Tax=Methylovulum psychrotolerans TaxID=1704499 RepID=A0A2S5CNB8_9GAMM|nr:Toxin ParE1 [Methylovulum psychrotolerans]